MAPNSEYNRRLRQLNSAPKFKSECWGCYGTCLHEMQKGYTQEYHERLIKMLTEPDYGGYACVFCQTYGHSIIKHIDEEPFNSKNREHYAGYWNLRLQRQRDIFCIHQREIIFG